jgi:glycosyltransferase involved in cell wall biosynthesis
MALIKIVSWQPVLTDHQAYTYQALELVSGSKLIAYIAETENSIRKSQGWTETKVTSVTRILIPQKNFFSFCFKALIKHKNDIHFFASPFQDSKLIGCLFLARILGLKFYLISEPYSPIMDGYLNDGHNFINTLKAYLRPFAYYFYILFLRGGTLGIFTISKLAYEQYFSHGIPKDKLFPFGYFVPRITQFTEDYRRPFKETPILKIVYVGALIRRKGLDVLQDAICNLQKKGYPVSLDIYGAGDEALVFSNLDFIAYKGLIPFGNAQEVIAHYDLLVLPSHYDGWGVVINEALCSNVPVVCADSVGAGEIAKHYGAGLSFSSGNSSSLFSVLEVLMDDPNILNALRSKTKDAADALQPEVAARYMLDVLDLNSSGFAVIQSPWYVE